MYYRSLLRASPPSTWSSVAPATGIVSVAGNPPGFLDLNQSTGAIRGLNLEHERTTFDRSRPRENHFVG